MKIAVPYENGEICSHLAQVKEFLIFDVVDDEIISTKIVKQTYANDPGALVEFLKKENTAVLLCDALPIPMMIALRETSIQVLGGAKGAPKDRVEDFLNGMLHFDPGNPMPAPITASIGIPRSFNFFLIEAATSGRMYAPFSSLRLGTSHL